MEDPIVEIYAGIGSDAPFYALVEAFYREVEEDSVLRSLYPDDLEPGKRHLVWFLIQRCGGPSHYGAERGHPKLRVRHMPFRIGAEESDAWVRHMLAALEVTPEFGPYHASLSRYFEESAAFLINKSEIPTI